MDLKDRLEIYVVSSHVDKPMGEQPVTYGCEIPIQAGAARTDKRICEVNDHDGFDDSISVLNNRLSEFTAMFWVWNHSKSDYIGMCHYRRRFLTSAEELNSLMDQGMDLIVAPMVYLKGSITEWYGMYHCPGDWEAYMGILKRDYPDIYKIAVLHYGQNGLHPAALCIYKREVLDECCRWMYPILFELMEEMKGRFDVYQNRDVAFIAERMVSLFIEYKKSMGAKVAEINADVFGNRPKEEERILPEDELMEVFRNNFRNHKISDSMSLLTNRKFETPELNLTLRMMLVYNTEFKELRRTFLEYFPIEISENFDELLGIFNGLQQSLFALSIKDEEEIEKKLCDLLRICPLSPVGIYKFCELLGLTDKDSYMNDLALIFTDHDLSDYAEYVLLKHLKEHPESQETIFNLSVLYYRTGDRNKAREYLDRIEDQGNEFVRDVKALLEEA